MAAKKKTKKPAAKKTAAKSPVRAAAAPAKKNNDAVLISPLDDRLVIRVHGPSEKTAGGIIIPGNVASKPNLGEVLAKGPGRRDKKGRLRPLDVKVGDKVLFAEYAGTKLMVGDEEVLILRENDLLGIVE